VNSIYKSDYRDLHVTQRYNLLTIQHATMAAFMFAAPTAPTGEAKRYEVSGTYSLTLSPTTQTTTVAQPADVDRGTCCTCPIMCKGWWQCTCGVPGCNCCGLCNCTHDGPQKVYRVQIGTGGGRVYSSGNCACSTKSAATTACVHVHCTPCTPGYRPVPVYQPAPVTPRVVYVQPGIAERTVTVVPGVLGTPAVSWTVDRSTTGARAVYQTPYQGFDQYKPTVVMSVRAPIATVSTAMPFMPFMSVSRPAPAFFGGWTAPDQVDWHGISGAPVSALPMWIPQ
jgi:hypothetical protein